MSLPLAHKANAWPDFPTLQHLHLNLIGANILICLQYLTQPRMGSDSEETGLSSLDHQWQDVPEHITYPYTNLLLGSGQIHLRSQFQRPTGDSVKCRSETNFDHDTDSNADAASVFSEDSSQSSRTSRSSSDSDEAASAYESDASSIQPYTSAELLRGIEQTSSEAIAICTRRQSCAKAVGAPLSSTGDQCNAVDSAKPEAHTISAPNARRSGGSAAPPCLKRDTDSADCFVILLIGESTYESYFKQYLTRHQHLRPSSLQQSGHFRRTRQERHHASVLVSCRLRSSFMKHFVGRRQAILLYR